MTKNIIDTQNIEYLIKEIGKIGSENNQGITRLAYSPEESVAYDFVQKYLRPYGFESTIDAAGNLLIGDIDNTQILIGSHLDTVPNGGKYDGTAGIVAGIEILKILKSKGREKGISLIIFRAEESSRFGSSHIGSSAFCFGIDEHILNLKDEKMTLSEAIKSCNLDPEKIKTSNPILSNIKMYLELHIEQADVLHDRSLLVGVVDGIAGYVRYEISLRGKFNHSGTTPINKRADAICAQSEITLLLEKMAYEKMVSDQYVIATIGYIETPQGSINQVCGYVRLGVDIRSSDLSAMIDFKESFISKAKQICARRGVDIDCIEKELKNPAKMDEQLISKIFKSVEELNITQKTLKMPSMAGHDAMSFIKAGIPSAMLFVPSMGGSHNPNEYAESKDVALGATIFANMIKNMNRRG